MPPWIGQGMSACVRDAANLCWKLAAVLRRAGTPMRCWTPTQTERKPHVTEVTRRAVRTGRLITERRKSSEVWLRNHLLRDLDAGCLGVLAIAEKLIWIPDAHYPDGFFATDPHAAVGWQLPQPWVTDATGERLRLDDVVAGRWAVLHFGAAPAAAPDRPGAIGGNLPWPFTGREEDVSQRQERSVTATER